MTNKSPAEIIAGAMKLFGTGGWRWNNHSLHAMKYSGPHKGEDTYCALGALSMAATGECHYPANSSSTAYKQAANLVAESAGLTNGNRIPNWNDNLHHNSFGQVKQVFCKALKVALEREAPAKRPRKTAKKRAA
jgi:hypothetical protein